MITADQREKLRGWFAGRLPEDLFESLLDVSVDREEITVIGRIREPRLAGDASDAEREAAVQGRIQEFRERTREDRVAVAREAEHRFRRKVSWGVECGGERALFTHVAAPVMTRLRQPERQVLDTLIAGGVARSRSEALAWCVRLVQQHTDDWLTELRESLEHVQRVRAQGPDAQSQEGQDSGPAEGNSGTT
jgi:DNA-binding IclR family transcriptional regulator